MSLVDASASRKARLEALRKRKAGDVVGEDGKPFVPLSLSLSPSLAVRLTQSCARVIQGPHPAQAAEL